jgi:hypothetical protein
MIHKRTEILYVSCEEMGRLAMDGSFEDGGGYGVKATLYTLLTGEI